MILISIAILSVITEGCDCDPPPMQQQELVSLTIDKMTSGDFIIGTGGFGDDVYYVFMVKNSSGAIKMKVAYYDNVTIYEDGLKIAENHPYDESSWILHLPHNAVIRNMDIDVRDVGR